MLHRTFSTGSSSIHLHSRYFDSLSISRLVPTDAHKQSYICFSYPVRTKLYGCACLSLSLCICMMIFFIWCMTLLLLFVEHGFFFFSSFDRMLCCFHSFCRCQCNVSRFVGFDYDNGRCCVHVHSTHIYPPYK